MNSIAVLADVHGNAWALDAVLADIARRGITTIVNLGDSVYGSLDPRGAAERLMAVCTVNIAGNQDRTVFAPTPAVQATADHHFVTSELSVAQIEWLRGQPSSAVVAGIFCCHGTPGSDETYLLEEVTPHGVFLRATAAIQQELVGVEQAVIVCAHSHVPRTVWLPSNQLVVNPGSVGIPAYDEELPYPHVMEAGSPHARYAILTPGAADWQVEHVALAYAWHMPAAVARQRERPDRARWIETGRAS